MPQSVEKGGEEAFLVPLDGPALALRHEETWIGRGSFPLSPAAEVLCSRKQACIQFDTSGWRIECHGLNPLYFVVCQHANFDATQDGERGLFRLCKGESTLLSNGDRFYLISKETLVRVVIHSPRDSHNQLSPQEFHIASNASAPSDRAEVQLTSECNIVERTLDHLKKDMQTVVATVTGYDGLERSKLIMLINKTGAAYTGKWTPGHTHLVCWKFAGPKYDMARKSGTTIILNHRWFEDCLSANCRLPEQPYTRQSGELVGPLLWKDTSNENCAPNSEENRQVDSDRKGKRIVDSTEVAGPSRPPASGNNISREASNNAAECSNKMLRKRNSRNASSSSHSLMEQIVRSPPSLECPVVAEASLPRRKSRRLVKKLGSAEQRLSTQHPISVLREVAEAVAPDRAGRVETVIDLCTPPQPAPQVATAVPLASQQAEGEALCGSPEFRTSFSGSERCNELAATSASNSLVQAPSECTPAKQPRHGETPLSQQPGKGSPEAELACIICFTNRKPDIEGALDCGHSFCFTCIHKWSLEARSKDPVCPLCKASFIRILRKNRNGRGNNGDAEDNIEPEEVFVGVQVKDHEAPSTREWACISCHSPDSPDLFCVCSGCSARAIHVFCIDPPGTRVNDDWSCPRCLMHRHRAQNINDWRRLLPGSDARGSGSWSISRLDGQPMRRAMRSIDLEHVDSGRIPNGSITHASSVNHITDRLRTSELHPTRRRRQRQQQMSNFLQIRQADQL